MAGHSVEFVDGLTHAEMVRFVVRSSDEESGTVM